MDITIVIRRTVIYSLVSAVLTMFYVGLILLLTKIFEGRVHSPNYLSVAVAGCAIALLFDPLRRRVQRFVDRHFFREALDQEYIRQLTTSLVHEIKRPLAQISLPAELTLMDLADVREGRKSLEQIFPRLKQRLQYIMDQSMDAGSRIEALRSASIPGPQLFEKVALPEVIRKSLSREETLLSQTQVQVNAIFPAALQSVQGHAKQLEIVFSNLIKNAAEALARADNPRYLWIKAAERDGWISASIKDSGPGIPAALVRHIFEPYFTTKGSGGMGMGLYLSQNIIRSHGGSIDVNSKENLGTEFIVRLPKDRSQKIKTTHEAA